MRDFLQASGSGEPEPQAVGGYRLLRPLGSGGMGTVYEAEEQATGRHVAVKVLLPRFAASATAVERFRQEGRLASMIAHPRCVFVLAADEEAGRPYIVMELMPGSTLKDLVDQQGPLLLEEAVAKVLDVIEGLQEAHLLGVIHRDVKPSNCFLLADGHVKIGDFGLSKSLVSDMHLTKTGTFLGTPLYASPEQIRGEPLDVRSDVYSVAATLYFLLTGQAPFQTNDMMAALARIVSEPAPSPRLLRPELPRELERVILRGLERQRERRWNNLAELRTALLPFLPGHLSHVGMGLRLAAYLVDCALSLSYWAILVIFSMGATEMTIPLRLAVTLCNHLPWIAYFVVMEGLWGFTAGKWLLRLRVQPVHASGPPGLVRALVRTLVYYGLVHLGSQTIEVLFGTAEMMTWAGLGSVALQLAGVLALVAPMRARNGFRGLHDLASGTQVVQLPWPEKQRSLPQHLPETSLSNPDTLPETVGPYAIQGALQWSQHQRILQGEDPSLGRKVWIRIRPATEPSLPAARRNLVRPTRLRWLNGGTQEEIQWEAYVAPSGCALVDLLNREGPLTWHDLRPLLQQLVEELVAACAEGTVPSLLHTDQVWIQPSGRVLLLDAPLSPMTAERTASASDQQRALLLLRDFVVLALEGKPRPEEKVPAPITAPVPDHARAILDRLVQANGSYQSVQQLQADLEATRGRPSEVNRALRAAHVGVLTLLLLPGLVAMLSASRSYELVARQMNALLEVEKVRARGTEKAQEIWENSETLSKIFGLVMVGGAVTIWPVIWVVWAFLARGGWSHSLLGISLRRADGRRPSRLRCAVRALLAWAPVTALLSLAVLLEAWAPDLPWLYFGAWFLTPGLLITYAASAVWFPRRSFLDWLSGTCLLPH